MSALVLYKFKGLGLETEQLLLIVPVTCCFVIAQVDIVSVILQQINVVAMNHLPIKHRV